MIYAPPGWGKSSFGAQANGSLFWVDQMEDGITTLKDNNLVNPETAVLPPVSSWEDNLGVTQELIDSNLDWLKQLTIDTLGGAEMLLHNHERDTSYEGDDAKFGSFHTGYKTAVAKWVEWLGMLDQIRDKGVRIVALCHSQVINFKNPRGSDYDLFSPDLHKYTWAATHKWAEMVLFGTYVTEVQKEKGKAKGKAVGGYQRVLHCNDDAAYTAKNRHGLPDTIHLGSSPSEAWTNFTSSFNQGS